MAVRDTIYWRSDMRQIMAKHLIWFFFMLALQPQNVPFTIQTRLTFDVICPVGPENSSPQETGR
jgi:hypothetical protein